MKKRILSLLLMLVMVVSLVPTAALAEDDIVAYAVTGGNIRFNKVNGEVTSCDSTVIEANIPCKIDGVDVTRIGWWAFRDCTNLVRVSIPDSVNSIALGAFNYGCDELKYIDVAEDNMAYSSVDGVLFDKSGVELKKYPAGKTNFEYVIPNSVISIGETAFQNCKYLEKAIMPRNLTTIGNEAFSWCKKIAVVEIPNSVSKIGRHAFDNCTNLVTVKVPGNVTTIEDGTFSFCTGLTNVVICDGVKCIDYGAFMNCTELESVEIPSSVTQIGTGAFTACVRLKNIDISSNITTINDEVFYGCESFTSIEIPSGIVDIKYYAFYQCINLIDIVIPNSVEIIEDYAFAGCPSLTDVYYTGTEEQWNAITIGESNEALLNATIHYNYHEHVTELRGAVEPTCTEDGYTGDEVCTICGETISQGETIPALGHKTELRNAAEPTCTEDGYTSDEVCTICGETISQGETIEATGHHYKGNTCTVCGDTRSTADTIRAWFQDTISTVKTFLDKIFGRI